MLTAFPFATIGRHEPFSEQRLPRAVILEDDAAIVMQEDDAGSRRG
jgi:hypothetical protein